MAVIERYTPVIELFGKRQAPSHIPFGYNLLGQKAYDATGAWPGKRSNIRLMELGKDAFFYEDALPGQDVFKPRALLLDYDLVWSNCGADQWAIIHTPEENTARAAALVGIEEQLTTLQAVPADKRTDEQRRQLAGAQNLINQLSAAGDSFLTTFSNFGGSGAEGVTWGLSAPNVPIDLLCKAPLSQDGAITLRLMRASPVDDQASHRMLFKLTNGQTCYGLEFGEANSVYFHHYRNMTATQRRNIEEQIEALLDTGRLTPADAVQIQQWKEAADAIEERNKLAGIAKANMPDADKNAIINFKRLMAERKAAKARLTPENTERVAELRKTLYYDSLPVNLQEDTLSLLNRFIDVTIMFHRRGFVSVRLDNNPPWIYKNKGIAKLRGYNTMLPANSRLYVHSDGGAWGLAVGRPQHKVLGTLWTQDIAPGFDFTADEVLWEFDADFSTVTTDSEGTFTGIGPYGTTVVAKVVMIQDGNDTDGSKGHIKVPSKYQLQLTLSSDPAGIYSPEIHYVNFQVLAGAVAPIDTVPTWQSLPSGDPRAKQLVVDLGWQETDKRASVFDAEVRDLNGEAGLPTDLIGREANVGLMRASDSHVFNLVLHGLVNVPEHTERRDIKPNFLGQLLWLKAKGASRVHMSVAGIEEVLNREVRWPITGNGKFPNDFMRQLCQNAGLREDEYAGIGAGNIGITKLQRAAAGEKPDIKPTPTARYWEYLQYLVRSFCKGWRLLVLDGVLTLQQEVVRDRPDLTYTTTGDPGAPLTIAKGFKIFQDFEYFYTEAIFTGAVDAQTGKRFSGNKATPEATNPAFAGLSLFHVGLPKVYVADIDDGLTSKEACILAARAWMAKYGLPPWYFVLPVAFNPDTRVGDLIRVNTIKALVTTIERGHVNAGRGELPSMVITSRVYEDVGLP